ncbi:MAG TPA: biosynthetic peptidoglycan transglycosylase [Candidatus Dormibacteraeota bacterium]|jgi:penicillin-binding protein 1A
MGRRLGRFAAAIILAGLVLAGFAWLATPDVHDAQARVEALAVRHRVPMLQPTEVPRTLALAVVATEDERFYSHHGIDVPGIFRAVIDDLRMGCACEGASTLTEQLVKEIYLNGSDAGVNKLVDVSLAFKLEFVLDKPHILADWLTLAPTGPTSYGVGPAACAYFGQPLADLDLAQYALLAGLPQSPVGDDPITHPEAALDRRGQVLDAMVGHRYVTVAEADAARAEPLLPATRPGC